MPRGFSRQEQEAIRERLLVEGRRLIERYGLSRTTVDDLARAAGIAKGSFYKFFRSKELLCMELMEQEELRIKAAILAAARDRPDARSAYRAVMQSIPQLMRDHSLVTSMRDSGDVALLARAVGADRLAEHFRADIETTRTFLEVLREKGADCRVDVEVFAGLMRGVVMMMMHEEEIGQQVAQPAFELLVSYIEDGLIGKEGEGE